MARDIGDILRTAARKLQRTRAAESAAVCATAAGLAAATAEIAWSVGRVAPVTAAIICAMPLLAGVASLTLARVRRRLDAEGRAGAASVCLFLGVSAAVLAGVLAGAYLHVPKLALPLALIPLGALAGVVLQAARPVTVLQAAIYLDVRCGLGERLSTAQELAAANGGDDGFDEYVQQDAAIAADGAAVASLPMWRRTRATGGALALVLLLCAVLALVPTLGVVETPPEIARLAGSLASLSPQQRRELARSFREEMRQTPRGQDAADALAKAAAAAETVDAQRLEELLAELKAKGMDVVRLVPADVASAAGLGGGNGQDGKSPATGTASDANDAGQETNGGDPDAGPGPARVYHPEYREFVEAGADPAAAEGIADEPGMAPFVGAWEAARSRAGDAVAAGKVPPRYRGLVRDFFAADR
jgi:hypothetical protein